MNNVIDKVIKKAESLKDIGDCFGIKITNNKGLFIQVEQNIDGEKEYFIELNDVDDEDCYYPCGEYNESAEFNNMEMLVDKIKMYLEYHKIA